VRSHSVNLLYLDIDLSRGWMGAAVGRVGTRLVAGIKDRRGGDGEDGVVWRVGVSWGNLRYVLVGCTEPVRSCRSVSKKRMTGKVLAGSTVLYLQYSYMHVTWSLEVGSARCMEGWHGTGRATKVSPSYSGTLYHPISHCPRYHSFMYRRSRVQRLHRAPISYISHFPICHSRLAPYPIQSSPVASPSLDPLACSPYPNTKRNSSDQLLLG
jgi:hypothetical protein